MTHFSPRLSHFWFQCLSLLPPAEPGEKVRVVVYRLAEDRIKSGVQDLGTVAAGEKAFHVVQVMSIAVELLVWAVPDDAGEP